MRRNRSRNKPLDSEVASFTVASTGNATATATSTVTTRGLFQFESSTYFPVEGVWRNRKGDIVASDCLDRQPRLAHIMGDPEIVSHCPFCGSGDIIAGGDGTISCGFCDRSFLVMEQPNYPAMPGDPNAVPPAAGMPTAPDPAVPGDPAAADPNAAPEPQPVNPQTDMDALGDAPPFKLGGKRIGYKTAAGVPLNEDDFVTHLAFLHGRDFILEG